MKNICITAVILAMMPLFVRAENKSLKLKRSISYKYLLTKDTVKPSDTLKVKDSLKAENTISKDSLKENKKEKKKTPYDLLFDKKKKETAKGGFITLHKVGEKLYFELPVKYLKKQILWGSSIASVSDPTFVTVGRSYTNPTTFYFDIQDSMVVMKRPNRQVYAPNKNESLEKAIASNFKDPTISAFKINAYSNDSTAVVFDMASVVAKSNSTFPIIPQQVDQYKISTTAQNQLAAVRRIKSFDNNVSIRTELNYLISATIMGIIPVVKDMPFTTEVTHSFILLPEQKMLPRFADARVGISATDKVTLTSDQQGVKFVYFTNRWNLTPDNEKQYLSGKLTAPKKPIVFYIDNHFPQHWKSSIKKGVLRWNSAFEKIGFKNAIEVRDFPQTSATFDADNIAYSTIRYIPFSSKEISSCFWTDPNSGEIINGTLSIFANTEDLLHDKRLVETAAVDASVRSNKLPKDLFEESLASVVTHHIGKILGLEVNLAASSAFSTESLRDKAFTSKYGISASVMDENPFNYVAQPSDKGVKLLQDQLGVYDDYAIDYNYRFLEGVNPEKHYETLGKMVDNKANNAMYRYVPIQKYGVIDPSALSDDLGDDSYKTAHYAFKNLEYINQHFPQWIKNDEDTQIKKRLYLLIVQKYYNLFKNIQTKIGGVYVNNSKESSNVPRYRVVDYKQQKEALLWSINTIKNLHQKANTSFERKGYAEISYYDQLLEYLASALFSSNKNILIASALDKNSLSQKVFFETLKNEIFALADGRTLSNNELFLQKFFIERASGAVLGSEKQKSGVSFNALQSTNSISENEGFGVPNQALFPKVYIKGKDQSDMLFYENLVSLKPKIEKAIEKASTPQMKAHYNYLLVKINKTIEDASK